MPHITTGTLPNGRHHTLVPLEGQKQSVDIRLAVEAGSVDETDAQSGVAHMVEHMVFRASEAYPSGVANMLHQKGWIRAQHYNAMTNYERTQYMMSPPAGKSDLPLAALSQMVGHASLRQSDLDDERKIILEEWRGKLGVAERMNQQRVQAIQQGSRYPDRPVIGTEVSINTMPATQLQDFYQRWYHPSNMRLMVIGDIVPQEVVPEIARQFGVLPAAALPVRNYYEPRLQKQLNLVRLQDSESGASQIAFVFRLNDPQSKTIGLEGVRHRLLDQIATNALQRQLRRQSEHLPDSVTSLVVRKSDIGKTTVSIGFFANVIPGEHQAALPVLLEEIERVKRYPLSERGIVELKNDIRQAANRIAITP
ncbi:MAG: M16 family metallopeptidase [Symbiopectobacterium sp.]|uniref:M16 family metallopeptidase n=1 Tax=Symbiopectobacterium sp. TaxID=2952789 RepID=UPI0039E78CBD